MPAACSCVSELCCPFVMQRCLFSGNLVEIMCWLPAEVAWVFRRLVLSAELCVNSVEYDHELVCTVSRCGTVDLMTCRRPVHCVDLVHLYVSFWKCLSLGLECLACHRPEIKTFWFRSILRKFRKVSALLSFWLNNGCHVVRGWTRDLHSVCVSVCRSCWKTMRSLACWSLAQTVIHQMVVSVLLLCVNVACSLPDHLCDPAVDSKQFGRNWNCITSPNIHNVSALEMLRNQHSLTLLTF